MEAALENYLASGTYRRDSKRRGTILVELYEDGKWESYPAPNFNTSQYQPTGAVLRVGDADEMRAVLNSAIDEVYWMEG